MVACVPAMVLGGDDPKTLRALRIDDAVHVDGVLDETVWEQTEAVADFFQRDPDLGSPATERTEVRIAMTQGALFFGVKCFDSEPSKIIARERRRDNTLESDDRFEIVLDTFHDHRNGFYFVTNPLGTRFDALITDEGIELNEEWDERWWAEARRTDFGWTVEIMIPLSSLRAPRDLDVWGINFKRFVRRKNELSQWTGWSRDFTFTQVSQAGHLQGLRGVETGLTARVKPYLLGGVRYLSSDGSSVVQNRSEAGIEVAKVGIGSGLVAEFTLNPDFAQVEVDDAVVNLTRFPLFFPEKREFFLERAGFFDFSLGGRRGGSTRLMLQMFFPRRIGLSENRQPVPVLAGAKVTGKVKGLELGLLNVQTRDFEESPGSNYSVFRVKKNILARSNFGMFFSTRQSDGNDFNRVLGADANFTLLRNMDLQASLGRSFTPGVTGDQWVGRAKFNWFSEHYEFFAEHLYIGKNFEHDIGFVRRDDIRRSDGVFVWEPRPDALNIRRLSIRSELLYLTDTQGRLLTREQIFQFSAHFHSGETVRWNTTHNLEQLDGDFHITPEVTIPARTHRFRNYYVEFKSRPETMVTTLTRFGWGSFFGGRRKFLTFSPAFRPNPEFSTEIAYEYNDVNLPQGNFRTQAINTRLNFNWSNRWLTSTLIQYETETRRTVYFFRLRYNYRPGDDLYFVFNQSSRTLVQDADRVFLIKFTRTFDF